MWARVSSDGKKGIYCVVGFFCPSQLRQIPLKHCNGILASTGLQWMFEIKRLISDHQVLLSQVNHFRWIPWCPRELLFHWEVSGEAVFWGTGRTLHSVQARLEFALTELLRSWALGCGWASSLWWLPLLPAYHLKALLLPSHSRRRSP